MTATDGKDQPIFVPPLEPSGLLEFDQDMLDQDPGVVNGAITKEVKRRLEKIGKSHISPNEQATEIDQALQFVLQYQGKPDIIFGHKKDVFGEIARKVDASRDLEQYYFDYMIREVLDSCASLDEQMELFDVVYRTKVVGGRYIQLLKERVKDLDPTDRLPYLLQIKAKTGEIGWTEEECVVSLIRSQEGLDDAVKHARYQGALELLSGSDPDEVYFAYHTLSESCPQEYTDIRKSLLQIYFDGIKRNGFGRSKGLHYFHLAQKLATTDPLYVARQIPEIARCFQEKKDTDHSAMWWDVFHTIEDSIDYLNPYNDDERGAIGKLGTVAISLVSGTPTVHYEELREVKAADIDDLKTQGRDLDKYGLIYGAIDTLDSIDRKGISLEPKLIETVSEMTLTTRDVDFKAGLVHRLAHLACRFAVKTGIRLYIELAVDQIEKLQGFADVTNAINILEHFDDGFATYAERIAHMRRRGGELHASTHHDTVEILYPEKMKALFQPISQGEVDLLAQESYVDAIGYRYPHNDRGYFGAGDSGYEHHVLPFIEADGSQTTPYVTLWHPKNKGKDMRIVDFGCGWQGRAVRDLKEVFGDTSVSAMGISGNVKEPTGRLSESDLTKQVELHQGNLSFARDIAGDKWIGKTDVGMSISTLQYPVDPWGVIAEEVSFLKPGGTLFISTREEDFRHNARVFDVNGDSVPIEKILQNINMMDAGFDVQWGFVNYQSASGDPYRNFAITIRKREDSPRVILPLPLRYVKVTADTNRLGVMYIHPRNMQDDLLEAYVRVGESIESTPLPKELLPRDLAMITGDLENGGSVCITGTEGTGKSTLAREIEHYVEKSDRMNMIRFNGHHLEEETAVRSDKRDISTEELMQLLENDLPSDTILVIDATDYIYTRGNAPLQERKRKLLDLLKQKLNEGSLQIVMTRHGDDWDEHNADTDLLTQFQTIRTQEKVREVTLQKPEIRNIHYTKEEIGVEKPSSDEKEHVQEWIEQDLHPKPGMIRSKDMTAKNGDTNELEKQLAILEARKANLVRLTSKTDLAQIAQSLHDRESLIRRLGQTETDQSKRKAYEVEIIVLQQARERRVLYFQAKTYRSLVDSQVARETELEVAKLGLEDEDIRRIQAELRVIFERRAELDRLVNKANVRDIQQSTEWRQKAIAKLGTSDMDLMRRKKLQVELDQLAIAPIKKI